MKFLKITFILISLVFYSCSKKNAIASPDNDVKVEFKLSDTGIPTYQVTYKNETIIKTSTLGFDLKDVPPLRDNFEVVNSIASSFNEKWQMPWGEQVNVVNNYNELKVELQETSELKRKLTIIFKVYDD